MEASTRMGYVTIRKDGSCTRLPQACPNGWADGRNRSPLYPE